MGEHHPNHFDPRPKRRKDTDNPYMIFTRGIHTDHPQYYLFFEDVTGTPHCMEISKELFDSLDRFELEDLSYMNEVDRHYEQSEQTEASLNKRAMKKQDSIEEEVQQRMEIQALHAAISNLPETQRRRLVLHYFGEFTYEQIARMEGCTKRAVKFSVDLAIKKMKKIL